MKIKSNVEKKDCKIPSPNAVTKKIFRKSLHTKIEIRRFVPEYGTKIVVKSSFIKMTLYYLCCYYTNMYQDTLVGVVSPDC